MVVCSACNSKLELVVENPLTAEQLQRLPKGTLLKFHFDKWDILGLFFSLENSGRPLIMCQCVSTNIEDMPRAASNYLIMANYNGVQLGTQADLDILRRIAEDKENERAQVVDIVDKMLIFCTVLDPSQIS